LLTVSNFTFTDHVVGCTTQVQVGHMFEEVNYIQEGQNAERFGRLYGLHAPYSK
jgi:predicted unusual protein kinase regulating ubiquinone biosynthesis (AarF/ABC1/UbiB family)